MSTQTQQLPLLKVPLQYKADLHFSTNWNNKLNCNFFTTIRLANYNKYHKDAFYKVHLQNQYVLDAQLVSIRYCKLEELPPYTCYLDTGYDFEKTKLLLQQMYLSKNINWSNQQIAILLFKNLDFTTYILKPIKQ